MTYTEISEIIGAVFLSLGGGTAIVFVLSKWLGGVWAGRILENERAELAREHELLIRRRNVYTKLALSMRVFLNSTMPSSQDQRNKFLAAYDEAVLWAVEDVAIELGTFLDLQVQYTKSPGSIPQEDLQKAFVKCMTVMRKDCGFSNTKYQHRIVVF